MSPLFKIICKELHYWSKRFKAWFWPDPPSPQPRWKVFVWGEAEGEDPDTGKPIEPLVNSMQLYDVDHPVERAKQLLRGSWVRGELRDCLTGETVERFGPNG
jgi:hypothetical protein